MDRAQEIGASVRTLEDVGEAQYQQFRKERLIERTVNLKEPIKENRLISPSSSLTTKGPSCTRKYIQLGMGRVEDREKDITVLL